MKNDDLGMLAEGLKEVSRVIEEGEKTHPKDDWKSGELEHCISDHLAHAETHLREFFLRRSVKYSAGVKYRRLTKYQREDIAHAATRCLMALQLFEKLFDEKDAK